MNKVSVVVHSISKESGTLNPKDTKGVWFTVHTSQLFSQALTNSSIKKSSGLYTVGFRFAKIVYIRYKLTQLFT